MPKGPFGERCLVARSMTGFGEAHCLEGGLSVSVELRAVNSRYFKLSMRTTEGYGSLEPLIEAAVRKRVRRGTLLVSVQIDRAKNPDDYKINPDVLDSYRRQLAEIQRIWASSEAVPVASLLLLPGVVEENAAKNVRAGDAWPVVCRTLAVAIDRLDQMRQEEGRAMVADLRANGAAIAASLAEVQKRAPLVAEAYRARLQERLTKTLAEMNVTFDPADVLKEVGLFAERSDISEEVVRLRSHLQQFDAMVSAQDCPGRKLEFLTQEMLREANTIGSKANDLEISRHVIEIKAAIERIREMIQNIE